MKAKPILIAAAIVVLHASGCSTHRNLMPSEAHDVPPMKIYGGVTEAVKSCQKAPVRSGVGAELLWPFVAVDVVASAVADTFTLPITIISCLYRYCNEDVPVNEPYDVLPVEVLPASIESSLP